MTLSNPGSSEVRPKKAAGQYHGPEPAASFQEFIRAGGKCLIHPGAWPAFFRAAEAHALNLKLPADQVVQIHVGGNDIAPEHGGSPVLHAQFAANRLVGFQRKKGYLAFVVFLEIKEPVPP